MLSNMIIFVIILKVKKIVEMYPFKIILNHLRIFKNWLRFKENLGGIIILGIIGLLTLFSIRQLTAQHSNNQIIQISVILSILPISFMLTNAYLIITKKENKFLLTLLSKSELRKIRKFQATLSNILIFVVISFFLR